MGEEATWKCPVCGLGVPPNHTASSWAMRVMHWREVHPDLDQQQLRLVHPMGSVNEGTAMKQVRAAGVARRLLGIKKGDAGEHDVLCVSKAPCQPEQSHLPQVRHHGCQTALGKLLRQQAAGNRGPQRFAIRALGLSAASLRASGLHGAAGLFAAPQVGQTRAAFQPDVSGTLKWTQYRNSSSADSIRQRAQ